LWISIDRYKKTQQVGIIYRIINIPGIFNDIESEIEITIDVSDFSTMFMGCIQFKELYDYDLAQINNIEYVNIVNEIFKCFIKLICMTSF